MMNKPMTFGEYLAQLMNAKRITVTDLTRRMNYRSKTSISRILRDEVRYSSIEDFMTRLEPMEDWLLSPEEKQALRQAMEVSRLGRARYQAYRDIWRLVKKPCPCSREVQLEYFGPTETQYLSGLARRWREASSLNMTIINSGYNSLFREIRRFLDEKPGMPADIRHYLAVDDAAGSMAEQLAALSQVFQDQRYHGFYRSGYTGRNVNPTAINDFVVVNARMADGSSFTQVICMLAEDRALAYENPSDADLGEMFRRIMDQVQPDALPIKQQYPCQEKMDWLITITGQYLSCERDRSVCCLAPDVCFELISLDILKAALVGTVFTQEDLANPRVGELMRIHRARFDNISQKRQKSSYIFSMDSLTRFMQTGCTTDHVAGMRPFTVQERKEILLSLVQRVRENVYLTVRILKDDIQARGMTLTVYEGLGVYLLDSNTQYDVTKGHSEAFLLMPALTDTLAEFFREELIEKHVHSEAESLEMLEKLALGETE